MTWHGGRGPVRAHDATAQDGDVPTDTLTSGTLSTCVLMFTCRIEGE
jgi:hypothetical protein